MPNDVRPTWDLEDFESRDQYITEMLGELAEPPKTYPREAVWRLKNVLGAWIEHPHDDGLVIDVYTKCRKRVTFPLDIDDEKFRQCLKILTE